MLVLLEDFLVEACSFILVEKTCRGFVDEMAGIFIKNIDSLFLQPQYFCSEFLNSCDKGAFIELDP